MRESPFSRQATRSRRISSTVKTDSDPEEPSGRPTKASAPADDDDHSSRLTKAVQGSRIKAEVGSVPSTGGGVPQVMSTDSKEAGMSSPRETFLRLVNGVCDGPYEDLADLYAERTHVTHPFHPLRPPPLRSRGELHEHFTAPPPVARTLNRKPVDMTIHETADPEVIVAEFAYQGRVDETGEAFTVPCVFVMRIRDGLIIESRDYIDHIASARAWGQLDSLLTALRPQESTTIEGAARP
jgi:ketosteroid isomerase-like protein